MILSDKYWSWYILVKHMCEVVVLTLELIISTAIKSYDTRSAPPLHSTATTSGGPGSSAVPFSRPAVNGRGLEMTSAHGGPTELTPMLATQQQQYYRSSDNEV